MVGKIISGFLKTIIFLFLFWLLSSIIVEMALDFVDDYDMFNTEDTPAIVTEKVSVNNLTSLPKYYVIVDLNEDRGSTIKNRVFAWQFKQLEIGDTVKGHYIHGNHFFTTIDIIIDSTVIILLMILMLFFMLALIMWPVVVFADKWKKSESYTQKRKKMKQDKMEKRKQKKEPPQEKGIKPFLKRVLPEKAYQFLEDFLFDKVLLIIFSTIALIVASGFAMNGLYKLSPVGKKKTTAYVTDSEAKSETYYYIGRYSDPYYTLDLTFEDKRGEEYRVIKEVTRSVYRKHMHGGPIEISYSKLNPYNVFVRDYSFLNLVQGPRYAKFWFPSMTIILFIIFFAIDSHFRKKRKEKVDPNH